MHLSPAIQLVDVAKTFTDSPRPVTALQGVSLEVKQGEFLSLVGPSGCGKTTILNLVAGLDEPTAGTVQVNGQSPSEARRARSFGLVFQSPVLFDWRNVYQNVALAGEVFHDKEILSRTRDAIALVGLSGFEDAYPRQLSGGMKSRVAIARVMTFHPPVLLMDEPFGELDEVMRTRMNFELLKIWQNTRATVLFVTHSVTEAVLLSDRVAVMSSHPGKIEASFEIDMPRPRTLGTYKTAGFSNFVNSIRTALLVESSDAA